MSAMTVITQKKSTDTQLMAPCGFGRRTEQGVLLDLFQTRSVRGGGSCSCMRCHIQTQTNFDSDISGALSNWGKDDYAHFTASDMMAAVAP